MSSSQTMSKIDPSNPNTLIGLEDDVYIGIISRLYDQNLQLTELLRIYVNERYGQKTERFEDPDQLRLFEDAGNGNEPVPAPGEEEVAESGGQKRRGTSRQRKPHSDRLQKLRIPSKVHAAEELICTCCGKQRVKVNEVVVHCRYQYMPASVSLHETVDEIFACPECDCIQPMQSEESETNSNTQIDWTQLVTNANQDSKQATEEEALAWATKETLAALKDASARAIRCTAAAGMLSYISVSKYCDHLPLYRLEQILGRQGAEISSSTMCGWLAIASDMLRGIYELMQSNLLQSKVIKTDDTPVKVLDRKTKKKIRIGRIWVYIGDKDHPYILFHYTKGRGRAGPKEFLKGFKRYLQGDCFSGNEAICAENGAALVACNAHARRYFAKALLNYKKKSEEALRFFQKLFKIEEDAKELGITGEGLRLMREQESKPLLEDFKKWLEIEHQIALPKSSFGKAVSYCLNNWEALTAYLADGDLCIDNNEAERQMKGVATGRKAWLFFGSDDGGERAEVLMSVIATCKMHGIDPWAYLNDVIETMTMNPLADLRNLLPTNWKPKPEAEAKAQSLKVAHFVASKFQSARNK